MREENKHAGSILVICAYKPKPGKEAELLDVVKTHVAILQECGLATKRTESVMKAANGTIVEVFEWASSAAIAEAHKHPRVLEMWGKFNDCSDPVTVGDLDEAKHIYSDFTPVNF